MTDVSSIFTPIPGILHGFGSKTALLPVVLQPFRTSLPEKKQVYGTRIVDVTEPNQICGEADGLYTSRPGVLLTVLTADCLPVIFSRRDGKAIAVAHAGWRGLLDGILQKMAERIAREDSLNDWVVAIGPAVGSCCYEVTEQLVAQFIEKMSVPATVISPRYRHLNLTAIAEYQLQSLGFYQVDRVGSCTLCTLAETVSVQSVSGEQIEATPFKYTSFRRNSNQRARDPSHPGISGRNQYSGLIIQP
ncbi:polyphenol oxidase family protein [Yersinia ruckeri]|uniref:polyphenol oxidase family protein n=1 Tax=Yersinia ruckeri TaxID=29486 RepID=UPI002237A4E3|nr:polyphenol oxidase family protein [Yersinia ruckeri]MCW6564984.1 polyphenol oxidase family protein [Yersinia ruckeri]MCW6574983.1 polyphenol oxidase family protein [Yersinia ruckeri]